MRHKRPVYRDRSKSAKGKQSEYQKEFERALMLSGGIHFLVCSLDEAGEANRRRATPAARAKAIAHGILFFTDAMIEFTAFQYSSR